MPVLVLLHATELGVHASRRNRMLRLTGDEFRATCALRLGVDAFPQPSMAITCPDCQSVVSDRTAHALACSAAQDKRTMLHTAMEVAARTLLRELDDELVVTGSKGAYPFDHGFKVTSASNTLALSTTMLMPLCLTLRLVPHT